MNFGDPKPKILQNRPDPEKGEATEKERKIRRFLAENLSETEERITDTMDANCKVAVVIPAYCERYHILRMIKSLAEQEGTTPDEYELIVVVNNPDSPPERVANEKSEDFSRKLNQFNKAVSENQETLKLISHIKDENTGIEMSDYEQQVIETIRSSGLRIHAIDKASPGKTLPGSAANTGGARNRGVAEAVERFFKQGRNGIIAQTDADSSVDGKYISSLIKTFDVTPELVGISGGMDMQVKLGSEMTRLVSLYDDVQDTYQRLLNDLSIEGDSNLADNNFFNRVQFFGANMASRAFETAIAGGIPKISWGEDTKFGEQLSHVGVIKKALDVIVISAIRFSSRTGAGDGGQRIKTAKSLQTEGIIMVGNPESEIAIKTIIHRLAQATKNQQNDPNTLHEIFQYKGVPLLSPEDALILSGHLEGVTNLGELANNTTVREIGDRTFKKIYDTTPRIPLQEAAEIILDDLKKDMTINARYEQKKNEMIKKENGVIERTRQRARELFNIVSKTRVDENSLPRFLLDRVDQLGISWIDIDRLVENPLVLKETVHVINNSSSAEQLISKLEKIFPEQFVLVGNNPLHLLSIELNAMHKTREEYHQEKVK